MSKPIERELKILISKENMNSIIQSYDFKNPLIQRNTYYDTPEHLVQSMHGAVRIRTIGNRHIFTLKIRKDEITHIELEKEIFEEHILSLNDDEIKGWLKEYNIPLKLYPIATFTTIRRTLELEEAELCADITEYPNHTDYELEYEYKKEHNGIEKLNQILAPFHIEYKKNCPSKIARAMADQNL